MSLEQKIAAFFAAVLDLPDVGPEEDFFELGGHSLLAGRVAALIRRELGVRVTVSDFFEGATPRQLAEVVREAQKRIPVVR